MVNMYVCIVVEGVLGVYLQHGDQRLQNNVLELGETVGNLDALDGEPLWKRLDASQYKYRSLSSMYVSWWRAPWACTCRMEIRPRDWADCGRP